LMWLKQSSIEKWETENGNAWVTQTLETQAITWENEWETRISIPSEKLLLFTYDKEWDNLEWTSLLRPAYRPWKQKDNIQKWQMQIIEKSARWTIQAFIPPNASTEDKKKYWDDIAKLSSSRSNIIIHPWTKEEGWLVEYLDTKISSEIDFDEILARQDRAIWNATLTMFLNTSNSPWGSNARAKTEMDFFIMWVNGLLWEICDNLNNYLIKKIAYFNSWDNVPYLTFDELELNKDYWKIASSYKTLIDAWLIKTDIKLEDFVRRKFELPEKDDIEETEEIEEEEKKEELKQPEEIEIKEEEENTEEEKKFWYQINFKSIVDAQINWVNKTDVKPNVYYNHSRKFQDDVSKNKYEKKVNLKEIQNIMDTLDEIIKVKLKEIWERQKDYILKNVEKALRENDLKLLDDLNIPWEKEIITWLTEAWKEGFEVWKKSANEEMETDTEATKQEVKWVIRWQNESWTKEYIATLWAVVGAIVSQEVKARWWDVKLVPVNEVLNVVSKELDKTIDKHTTSAQTQNVTWLLNSGRTSAFEKNKKNIYGVQYSAILDRRTTVRCRHLNWRVMQYWSSDYYNYAPPWHYRCRSIYVEIMLDEVTDPKTNELRPDTPEIKKIPTSIPETWPLSSFKDMKK